MFDLWKFLEVRTFAYLFIIVPLAALAAAYYDRDYKDYEVYFKHKAVHVDSTSELAIELSPGDLLQVDSDPFDDYAGYLNNNWDTPKKSFHFDCESNNHDSLMPINTQEFFLPDRYQKKIIKFFYAQSVGDFEVTAIFYNPRQIKVGKTIIYKVRVR